MWVNGCVYICMGVGVRVSCVFVFVCCVCGVCVVCVGCLYVWGVCECVCGWGLCVLCVCCVCVVYV